VARSIKATVSIEMVDDGITTLRIERSVVAYAYPDGTDDGKFTYEALHAAVKNAKPYLDAIPNEPRKVDD